MLKFSSQTILKLFLYLPRFTLVCLMHCWLLRCFLKSTEIAIRYTSVCLVNIYVILLNYSSLYSFQKLIWVFFMKNQVFFMCSNLLIIFVMAMQDILCHDCDRKGTSRFHWMYHKCEFCGSYNTRVIKSEATNSSCP